MTPGRPPARGKPTLSAADYPALASFFSGYLHEDFVEEHGSPSHARRAFEQDASPDERTQWAREAAAFLEAAAAFPFDRVLDFLRRDLGAAWRPANLADLERLLGPRTSARR